MTKIDWKRKLSSRKFWVALVAFVTALLVAFNVDAGSVEQVAAIIMSFGSLIAYTSYFLVQFFCTFKLKKFTYIKLLITFTTNSFFFFPRAYALYIIRKADKRAVGFHCLPSTVLFLE